MATQRCERGCSASAGRALSAQLINEAVSDLISSSRLAYVQLFLLLLSPAFCSLAHSHPSESSSLSSAAASSRAPALRGQEELPSIIANMKPFIYETVAASSRAGRFFNIIMYASFPHIKKLRLGPPLLLDESVVAQFYKESHAAGGHHCKHVQGVLKIQEPLKFKLSFRNEHTATSSRHSPSPRTDLCMQDNGPQPDNVLSVDYGDRHVHESPAAALPSTQEVNKPLQDNVPQKKYAFLLGDGRKKQICSTHHSGNNKNWLVDAGPRKVRPQSPHNIGNKKSLNVQESKLHVIITASHLHDNVAQGTNAFLVGDGRIEHTKEKNSHLAFSKEVDILLHDNVLQEKHGSAKHRPFQYPKSHGTSVQRRYSSLIQLAYDDDERKKLHSNNPHKDRSDDNVKNRKKPPIYHKLCRLGKGSLNEKKIRMVVGDFSKTMHMKTRQLVTRVDDGNCNDENLHMVAENDSVKMIHEEHPMKNTEIGNPEKENLRMVVGDASEILAHQGRHPNMPNSIKVVGPNSTRIHKGFEAENYPAKQDHLKMVVGDESSNDNTQPGFEVQSNPYTVENLKMVVDDSSNSLLQEGYDNSLKDNNLRMTVDDIPNILIKKGPFRTRGRSRSCTSDLDTCHQSAYADHIYHIALYGQPTPEKRPACCGGVCVDLNTDHLNCGRCGNACGLSQITCCNGKCTDLNKDDSNCGQCGHSCLSFSPCQYGMCGYY